MDYQGSFSLLLVLSYLVTRFSGFFFFFFLNYIRSRVVQHESLPGSLGSGKSNPSYEDRLVTDTICF